MPRPTSECEFDPDHLYHDHREADELRADVELLTRNRDAARMIIGPLSERSDLVDACEDVVRAADELRAEIERLEAEVVAEHELNRKAMVEIERLRATVAAGLRVLEEMMGTRSGQLPDRWFDDRDQFMRDARALARHKDG